VCRKVGLPKLLGHWGPRLQFLADAGAQITPAREAKLLEHLGFHPYSSRQFIPCAVIVVSQSVYAWPICLAYQPSVVAKPVLAMPATHRIAFHTGRRAGACAGDRTDALNISVAGRIVRQPGGGLFLFVVRHNVLIRKDATKRKNGGTATGLYVQHWGWSFGVMETGKMLERFNVATSWTFVRWFALCLLCCLGLTLQPRAEQRGPQSQQTERRRPGHRFRRRHRRHTGDDGKLQDDNPSLPEPADGVKHGPQNGRLVPKWLRSGLVGQGLGRSFYLRTPASTAHRCRLGSVSAGQSALDGVNFNLYLREPWSGIGSELNEQSKCSWS
jgi:hypothetical protein